MYYGTGAGQNLLPGSIYLSKLTQTATELGTGNSCSHNRCSAVRAAGLRLTGRCSQSFPEPIFRRTFEHVTSARYAPYMSSPDHHNGPSILERLRRVGLGSNRLILTTFLVGIIITSLVADITIAGFSHWMSQHALITSLVANIVIFAISFGVYDQIVRVREARNLVRDHDLWNLRSRVDRAGETLTRALLVWQGQDELQETYLSGEKKIEFADKQTGDLSRGRGRARYCSETLPVALVDPSFYTFHCDHHRLIHSSLHECLLYDLEKLEDYLSEYAQRYRDTGYPDFWLAVDASERCQLLLDALVHQLRNLHNPRHPAKPSTILNLCEEYMEERHKVSASAHHYGRPKSALYVPLELVG